MNEKDELYMTLMAAAEEAQPIVDLFTTLRLKFEAAGFANEAAGLLVVEVVRATSKQMK